MTRRLIRLGLVAVAPPTTRLPWRGLQLQRLRSGLRRLRGPARGVGGWPGKRRRHPGPLVLFGSLRDKACQLLLARPELLNRLRIVAGHSLLTCLEFFDPLLHRREIAGYCLQQLRQLG